MWLLTRYGVYSIACANKPSGGVDLDTLMIRARRKSPASGTSEAIYDANRVGDRHDRA
jgi:hypothetical protein